MTEIDDGTLAEIEQQMAGDGVYVDPGFARENRIGPQVEARLEQAVADARAADLKVLLILDDFRGWKRGDDWGDLDFFSRYEASIAKIAVVGEPRWEAETLLFLGAGRRKGRVQYFMPHFEGRARAWLAGGIHAGRLGAGV